MAFKDGTVNPRNNNDLKICILIMDGQKMGRIAL